mgnify:CR=1 FL=1
MREMKDSGIEWIGTIPFDWKCCKQKYEIQLINGRAYSDSEFEEDGKYRILRVGNLFSNPTWYTSSLELPPDKYCENGDLLYSWSMSYAPVIWSGEKVIYHYHIWKTKLSSNLNKKFAYYYLSALTDALKAKIHETTMGFITMGVMNNSYIAFPCLKEQEKIVSFLDSQCSEIDALSADIQKEIETLEQYKRSVITEAVTKGLNPDVEMKDSGIEWVGNVPDHWGVLANKYVMKKRKDICTKWNGENVLSLTMNGVIVRDLDNPVGKMPTTFDGYQFVYSGNLLMCLFDYDVTPRCVGIVKNAGVTSPAYSRFELKENATLEYFYYYYLMIDFTKELLHLAKNLRHSFTEEQLGALKVPLPPLDEQKNIATYLDSKCKEIESVIASKKQQLEVLDSYKKSLIYEYVTGKKEVPNEQ